MAAGHGATAPSEERITIEPMRVWWIFSVLAATMLLACADDGGDAAPADGGEGAITSIEGTDPDDPDDPAPTNATTETTAEPDPEPVEPAVVAGTVVAAADGSPLAGASVAVGEATVVTGPDGRFSLDRADVLSPLTVERPGWQARTVELDEGSPDAGEATVRVELEPFTVRGLRVSRPVAADGQRFRDLLTLAEDSTVNTLVFDTKDETGEVLYRTGVELAAEIGAVNEIYRPEELLELAEAEGLYAITRIVTFEDDLWAEGVPGAKLAGDWVDATDRDNWRYPLDLAVEACELGFDEIQFDYIRYPAGRTATAAAAGMPGSSEARSENIAGFLSQAASELHPLGCGLSAAVFGIVTSSPTDEGIGQQWEMVTEPIDAVSPMVYPSHYNRGWLGLADPEEAPGPVVADALDQGLGRLEEPTRIRPWLQAFNYNGAQVMAQIFEAEERGAGWMLWNASGRYRADWLPSS